MNKTNIKCIKLTARELVTLLVAIPYIESDIIRKKYTDKGFGVRTDMGTWVWDRQLLDTLSQKQLVKIFNKTRNWIYQR